MAMRFCATERTTGTRPVLEPALPQTMSSKYLAWMLQVSTFGGKLVTGNCRFTLPCPEGPVLVHAEVEGGQGKSADVTVW